VLSTWAGRVPVAVLLVLATLTMGCKTSVSDRPDSGGTGDVALAGDPSSSDGGLPDINNGVDVPLQCADTQVVCWGVCTTLGTNGDCARCGDFCPKGGACQDGECRCPGRMVDCDGICTELGTNDNCAGCGNACDVWESCLDGRCYGGGCGEKCDEGVTIPAGSFRQGCDESVDERCKAAERPYHEVDVPAFEIDRYEVTVGQYRVCRNAGACSAPGPDLDPVNLAAWYDSILGDEFPIGGTNWYQARDYCAWAGKRLCSESEWEKAARGTDGRIYPWGSEPSPSCDYCVMRQLHAGCDNFGSYSPLWRVGSKPAGASPHGVMDMCGNVWEWVEDDFHRDYTGAPANGAAWVDEPRAPERVRRGGGYDNWDDGLLRSSQRMNAYPSSSMGNTGVRCCRSR